MIFYVLDLKMSWNCSEIYWKLYREILLLPAGTPANIICTLYQLWGMPRCGQSDRCMYFIPVV